DIGKMNGARFVRIARLTNNAGASLSASLRDASASLFQPGGARVGHGSSNGRDARDGMDAVDRSSSLGNRRRGESKKVMDKEASRAPLAPAEALGAWCSAGSEWEAL